MAITASKLVTKQPQPKRGQIKIKIFKLIVKSLKELANGVAGVENKAAGNGDIGGDGLCSLTDRMTLEKTVGRFNSGSERAIRKNRPRRGQIKVKIFKMFVKSLKDLAIKVAGGIKEPTGNGRSRRGCIYSPATVIPVEHLGESKSVLEVRKKIAGSVIEVEESR